MYSTKKATSSPYLDSSSEQFLESPGDSPSYHYEEDPNMSKIFKKKKKKKSLWGRLFSSSSSSSWSLNGGSITQQTIATTTSTSVRSAVLPTRIPSTIMNQQQRCTTGDRDDDDDDIPPIHAEDDDDPDGSITDTSMTDFLLADILEDDTHHQPSNEDSSISALCAPSTSIKKRRRRKGGFNNNESYDYNNMSDITMMCNDCSSSVASIPESEEQPQRQATCSDDQEDAELESLTIEELLDRASALSIQKEYRKALVMYQHVYHYRQCGSEVTNASAAADMANLCFACTQLCERLSDYDAAMQYAHKELEYTQLIQHHSLAVARCYHELAKISKYGLGNLEEALSYYQAAYAIEQACGEQTMREVRTCQHCRYGVRKSQRRSHHRDASFGNSNNMYYCDHHQAAIHDVEYWMRESKDCIGRTSFELGYLDRALEML